MKKILTLVLMICLLISLSGCNLDEVCFLNNCETRDEFFYGVNRWTDCCYVGRYECMEYTENMEITIPDEYDGMPVKRMGGYFGRGVPTPFYIDIGQIYMNAPEGSRYNAIFDENIDGYQIPEDYVVENLVFYLNLGKNIEAITYVVMDQCYPHINEDGSITFYHPVVKINCSEENRYFYSKDGKLYRRDTDELVEEFSYAN